MDTPIEKKDIEEKLSSLVQSGPPEHIKLFNVNGKVLVSSDGDIVLADGGIEFKFPSGTFLLGWHQEFERMALHFDSFHNVNELGAHEMQFTDIDALSSFAGSRIVSFDWRWTSFQYLDAESMSEDGEFTMATDYIPLEINLNFNNNQSLQIALVDVGDLHNVVNSLSWSIEAYILINADEPLTLPDL